MMSSLLDGIVERLVPPFTLSKLEGDAVFVYATETDLPPRGADFRACIDGCYAGFRAGLEAAHGIWTCTCDACLRIESLELKFIVHTGPFVIQEIAGRSELIGPEVVMAHRLLKTEASNHVDRPAYLLVTAAAASRLEIPIDHAVPLVASYEHYAPIDTFIFPLEPS